MNDIYYKESIINENKINYLRDNSVIILKIYFDKIVCDLDVELS